MDTLRSTHRLNFVLLVTAGALALACAPQSASAALITLQNGTADFTQAGHSPDTSVNGVTTGSETGWAVDHQEGSNHTAAWTTATDVGFVGGTVLTFKFYHDFGFPSEVLGHFRLSVTTDTRSLNGNDNGGNVGANTWIQLTPYSATSQNGSTRTILGDNSIRASGTNPTTDIVTVVALTNLTGITGIRLEALTDPSLPVNGPGRAFDGNFVLTEITLDASVPEPASFGILALAGLGLIRRSHRR